MTYQEEHNAPKNGDNRLRGGVPSARRLRFATWVMFFGLSTLSFILQTESI